MLIINISDAKTHLSRLIEEVQQGKRVIIGKDAIEQRLGLTYFVQVLSDTRCWMQHRCIHEKSYTYKGQLKTRRFVPAEAKKPIKIAQFAQHLNEVFWYKRRVCEGKKGPIDYEFTRRRVTLSQDGLPAKTVWLIIKRIIDWTGSLGGAKISRMAPSHALVHAGSLLCLAHADQVGGKSSLAYDIAA